MDTVNQLSFISGVARDGDAQAMQPTGGMLFSPDGSVIAKWADGSPTKPISFPKLQRLKGSSYAPIFSDSDGKWVRLLPADDFAGQKCMLVWNSGTAQYEPIVSPSARFAPGDIADGTSCSTRYVAVLEGCDDSGTLILKKVTLNTIFTECLKSSSQDTLDFIAGCLNGARGNLAPVLGFSLGAVTSPDGGIQWGLVANQPVSAAVGVKTVFRFTGAIQTITVPSGATKMYVKLWGGSGGWGSSHSTSPGGGGGYSYGQISVTAGQTYGVMVGGVAAGVPRAAGCGSEVGASAYGFGGIGSYNACVAFSAPGGGMSAIVNGTTEPTKTDKSRMILVAGGGGGGFGSGTLHAGQGGNAAASSVADMQGVRASPGGGGAASGGGGYTGGPAGNSSTFINGGSGYASSVVSGAVITPAPGATIANIGDVDFQDQGGRGLAVISFGS